jgi:hypothetical protein
MTPTEHHLPETCAPAPLALLAEAGALLTQMRQSLDAEIRAYPTPIPRCDAQFNALYEQRGRIARALAELAGLDGEAMTEPDCRRALEAFLHAAGQSDLPGSAALGVRVAAWLRHGSAPG